MTRASEFSELRRFFEGYMHEDFVQEHGTPAGALRAFEADANDAERKRLRADAKRMLSAVEAGTFDDARALLARLGAKWSPGSRAAVEKWLTRAASGPR